MLGETCSFLLGQFPSLWANLLSKARALWERGLASRSACCKDRGRWEESPQQLLINIVFWIKLLIKKY